uniref:Uncharacterized protein n=1 Tax=Gopherus agassizii TaxID=38772 RepID=A0A452IHD3_9SAUR
METGLGLHPGLKWECFLRYFIIFHSLCPVFHPEAGNVEILCRRPLLPGPDWLCGEQFQSIARGLRDTMFSGHWGSWEPSHRGCWLSRIPRGMLWNCSPQSQARLWGSSSPSEQTVFRARSSDVFTSWVSPWSIQHPLPLHALPTASLPRRGPGEARGSCTPTSQSDVTLSQPVKQRFIR